MQILILCTGNSCRSQIAEGYLSFFSSDNLRVYSAGIEKHGVNPIAIQVMLEDGIDISAHTSNLIDEYRDMIFDFVITVCDNARENCPYFPGYFTQIHKSFPDPAKVTGSKEEIHKEFVRVRNMIKQFCTEFINNLDTNGR